MIGRDTGYADFYLRLKCGDGSAQFFHFVSRCAPIGTETNQLMVSIDLIADLKGKISGQLVNLRLGQDEKLLIGRTVNIGHNTFFLERLLNFFGIGVGWRVDCKL